MIVNLCSQCGKECLRKKQFRGTRYFCSDKCKYTLYNGIKSQKRALEKIVYTKTCEWVNCEVEFSTNQPNKKYCSDKCKFRVWSGASPLSGLETVCPICSKKFIRYQGIQRCCTVKCGRKYEKQKVKDLVYDHYGRNCNCNGCSESAMRFLSIDHVNNDGNIDRANGIDGYALYQKIIKEDFPDTYQVLCRNCNWAKRFGECPHNKQH